MDHSENERKKIGKKKYYKELKALQEELVKLQNWVIAKGLRVIVIFEGRDAAGKGGTIKRVTQSLNPRNTRVVALPKPTEKEITQWYFQRYVHHLPAAGEIVLFDRSWYNRAVVERVMGFCTDEQYWEFLEYSCSSFEQMLQRSGIILLKYWFSISAEEQEKRFRARLDEPTKRWKFSPIDLKSFHLWEEYSEAIDNMFNYTDTPQAPWFVVNADDKKRARLNMISHLLQQIPYKDIPIKKIELPERPKSKAYVRSIKKPRNYVPEIY
jgi:polyphosphate kinase 2